MASLSHTLQKSDLKGLRLSARASYERHRDLPRTLEQELRHDPLEEMTLGKGKVFNSRREAEGGKVLEGEASWSLGLFPEQRGKQLKLLLELGLKHAQQPPSSSASPNHEQPAQPDSNPEKVRELELDL